MRKLSLSTLGVLIKSAWVMTSICSQAVWKNLTGTISRQWVDDKAHEWARRLLAAAKVTVEIHNPHQVSFKNDRPLLVMCNHASHYDIPLSFAAVPGSLRMIAKKELSKVPFMGPGMKAADFAFIDRKNRKQAIKDLQIVKAKMQDGIIIWICPEGTRTRTGELGPFKKGGFITAKQTQALIIPLGIIGSKHIMAADSFDVTLNQTAHIHIGEPIDANDYEVDALMQTVESSIQRLISPQEVNKS